MQRGQFKIWRDSLVKEGWLEFDYKTAIKNKNFAQHKAGTKLLKYVNKEIQNSRQIATFDEVLQFKSKFDILDESKADKNEVAELKSEVHEMKASLEAIYKAFNLGEADPPKYTKLRLLSVNDEKQKEQPKSFAK